MGKGFNNYMCKKFFHPASRDNLKRVWMAEQQADAYKKKQEELRVQYEKEQDLHNNKALLSKESKDKLSVNFMYEPPPGAKKEREKEDNEPEYRFEWQRKYNAPRESYCKGDSEIRDQPFGIQVRNVRCIKCHKWGHINTDKECPLYSQAVSVVMAGNSSEPPPPAPDAMTLVQQMREDGLGLKKSALEAQQHLQIPHNSDLLLSDDEQNPDISFLRKLTKKEKKKLLKKLCKLEKKKKKTSKGKKEEKKRSSKSSSSSDSDSDDSKESKHKKAKKKKQLKDSDSEEENSKKLKTEMHRSKEERRFKSERDRDDKSKDYRSRNAHFRDDRSKENKVRDDSSRRGRYETKDKSEYRRESRKRRNSDSEDEKRQHRDDKRFKSR